MGRCPQPIGDILAELMTRRGYARLQATAALENAWYKAAGDLAAEHTRVGSLKRGVLEVIVTHSAVMQELAFRKPIILKSLAGLLPDEKINNIRFRAGTIE